MKVKSVKSSYVGNHGNNLSAKFWINHDPKKCEICRRELVKRNIEYLKRKQKELGLTNSQMLEWVKGKRDFFIE